MTLCERLKELKESSKMTAQQIADVTKIPVSTVNRILSGYTESPSFSNVCDIIVAMGGSVDEVIGIASSSEEPSEISVKPDRTIELYKRIIQEYRKWLKVLFILLLSLFGVAFTVLIIDALNGNFGYFRY